MFYKLLQKILFLLSPETAHSIVFFFFKIFQNTPLLKLAYRANHKYDTSVTIAGVTFPNRIGVAAGLDKDAEVFDALGALGFGFVEIGTLTPKPQPGNPKPRLFRLKKDKALINRMGFNNKGTQNAIPRLKHKKTDIIIGGNIGKNKITPNDNAIDDYVKAFNDLFNVVDYFVVNVSSPNTPGLRALQEKKPLSDILSKLQEINKKQILPKPIFLKIAPDLTTSQLDDIVEIVIQSDIAGVIATNTTIERKGISLSEQEIKKIGPGGLSGKPLFVHSTEILSYLRKKLPANKVLIGVGGIFSVEDAKAKLEAGADLIQIFTSFIYEGPKLVREINKALNKK